MANAIYQSGSDWDAAGTWSTGAAPTASDYVYILEGSDDLDTDLPVATAGINYDGLKVGPHRIGRIGNATNKLYLGTCDTDIEYEGLQCRECWLITDTADANSINVNATSQDQNALHLFGGTWTNVRARKAGMLRIGAGATVTNLYLMGQNVYVFIEQGATVTNVFMAGGHVLCEAAIATLLRMAAGTWDHQGDTTFNIATLDLYGGTFNFGSEGGTITTVNTFGNCVLNLNAGLGTPRAIATLNRYGGTVDKRGVGAAVTISTENAFAGQVLVGALP